jgi:hypothetical protein
MPYRLLLFRFQHCEIAFKNEGDSRDFMRKKPLHIYAGVCILYVVLLIPPRCPEINQLEGTKLGICFALRKSKD